MDDEERGYKEVINVWNETLEKNNEDQLEGQSE